MSRSGQHRQGDFARPDHYRVAVRFLRRIAPDKFSAKAGYSLTDKAMRQWTKHQRATVRKYFRYYRPLATSPKKAVRVKNKTKNAALYKSLYDKKHLPGVLNVLMPVDGSGRVKRVDIVDDDGIEVAKIQISPGVYLLPIYFADHGYTPDRLANDLENVIAEIWEKYNPDYASLMAGDYNLRISRERGHSNAIKGDNALDRIITTALILQGRYDTGENNDWSNWMIGINLYFGTLDSVKNYRKTDETEWRRRDSLRRAYKKAAKDAEKYEKLYKTAVDFFKDDVHALARRNGWGNRQFKRYYNEFVNDGKRGKALANWQKSITLRDNLLHQLSRLF